MRLKFLKQCRVLWLLLVFLLSSLGALPLASAYEGPLQIQSVALAPDGQTILIQANRKLGYSKNVTAVKLPNPHRLVIDIPDARVSTPSMRIPIRRNGVQEVELSESRGTFYNATRITVTVDSLALLNQLALYTLEDGLSVNLRGAGNTAATATSAPSSNAPLPVAQNVIQSIQYRDNQLFIRGAANSKLSFKNRLQLTDPSRLVLDIDNASVASRDLLKPLMINDGVVQQIRVGQFDDKTVRIVVETRYPERLQVLYPEADRSLATIGFYAGTAMNTLPAEVSFGEISRISVDGQEGGETVVRIATSVPMLHQIRKEDGKLLVELPNIAATPGQVPLDPRQYPMIQGLRLEPLTANQPNSKVVIDLQASETPMATRLSADGKLLEVTLMTPRAGGLSTRLPVTARVVVDAGHGGKDTGANRNGFNEKDLNLAVALRLKHELEARGVKVYMTRSTDVFLPLPEITRITNNIRPDLFISVHTNSSTNPSIRGLETYYYTPQSAAYAKRVHQKLVNGIASPDRGVRSAMFYVIHHTQVPAILVEMGYISNAQERSELVTDTRKQKTAEALAEGVVEYLKVLLTAKAR